MNAISKSEILGFYDDQTFTISAKQSDKCRYVDIIFMDGLFLFDFSDADEIILNWKHENGEDGFYQINMDDVDIDTSSIHVQLSSDVLSVAGTVKCDVEFKDTANQSSITTTAFTIIVGGNNA